jgi:hypothetical protein
MSWLEGPVSSDDITGLGQLRAAGRPGWTSQPGSTGSCWPTSPACSTRRRSTACRPTARGAAASPACYRWPGWPQRTRSTCPRTGAPAVSAHAFCGVERLRHLEYFHDHMRIESVLFDGAPAPVRGGPASRSVLPRPRTGAAHRRCGRPSGPLQHAPGPLTCPPRMHEHEGDAMTQISPPGPSPATIAAPRPQAAAPRSAPPRARSGRPGCGPRGRLRCAPRGPPRSVAARAATRRHLPASGTDRAPIEHCTERRRRHTNARTESIRLPAGAAAGLGGGQGVRLPVGWDRRPAGRLGPGRRRAHVRAGPARGDGRVRSGRLRQVHRPDRGVRGDLGSPARSTY